VSWGDIQGTLSNQTDLQSALDAKSDTSHNHDSVYVLKSGDTIDGDLLINNTSNDSMVTVKAGPSHESYFNVIDHVDNKLMSMGWMLNEDSDYSTSIIRYDTATGDIVGKLEIHGAGNVSIINTATPTQPNHLTPKNYVDTKETGYTGVYAPNSGVLVTSEIPRQSSTMFRLEIRGNSYGQNNIFTEIEGYVYTQNDDILQVNGIQIGTHFDVHVFFLDINDDDDLTNDVLGFWIQPQASAQSWQFKLYETNQGNLANNTSLPITVIDSAKPVNIDKEQIITPTRYLEGEGPINADTLDGLDSTDFASATHTHQEYLLKAGDTMTGDLVIQNTAPFINLVDTDDNKISKIANYTAEMVIQTEKNDIIISGLNGDPLGGEVFIKYPDGTHTFYHGGNDGAGSGLDADLWDGYQVTEGMVYKSEIPDASDLNNYTEIGLYTQSSDTEAGNGTNYPEGSAGILTVKNNTSHGGGTMIWQEYWTYSTNITYKRTYYNGTWEAWKEMGSDIQWGDIQGTLSNQTDLQNALDAKVPYEIIDAGDLNTIVTAGIRMITNATNIPGTDINGTLVNTSTDNPITYSQIWQTENEMWSRTGNDLNWNPWKQYGSMVFDGESLFITL